MSNTEKKNYRVVVNRNGDGCEYSSECYYEDALDCLNSIVLKDILDHTLADFYEIFEDDRCIYSASYSDIIERLSNLLD